MQLRDGNRHRKRVYAGDFKSHHSLWDGNGREPAGSWREVKDLIESGRLMIEPGTATWKGEKIIDRVELTLLLHLMPHRYR
jgi:hypothetical protein